MHTSPAAHKALKRMKKTDSVGYRAFKSLIPRAREGEGKILTGWSSQLAGCRSLRSGKIRLVYRPGDEPEIVFVGYRKNVYHARCDN